MGYLRFMLALQYVLFVTAGVYVKKRGAPEKVEIEEIEDPISNKNITKVDNDTLYEGDMRIHKKEAEQLYEDDGKRDTTIANSLDTIGDLWPKRIPYLIHTRIRRWKGGSSAIRDAMNEISSKTCLKFMKKVREKDYIYFVPDDGCWSYIGRQGGKQNISLPVNCWTKRIATHEILHALGFLHEQARPDRDDFVRILRRNVELGQRHNFEKYDDTVVDSLGEAYDYKSIMHYWNKEFSKNGRDTIQKRDDPNFVLGVTDEDGGLSVSDAKQLNLLYKCPRPRRRLG